MSFPFGYITIPGLAPAQQASLYAYQRYVRNSQLEQAVSNPTRRIGVLSSKSAQPPAPTNIRAVPNVANTTIAWDPVTVPILYYEVMISDDQGMGDPETVQVTETQYTYQGGIGDTTYYFQVRAVTENGISGWTPVLNGTTGVATFRDLEPGAATEFYSDTFLEFEPEVIVHDRTTGSEVLEPTYMVTNPIVFSTVDGGILSPRMTFVFLWRVGNDLINPVAMPQIPDLREPPMSVNTLVIDGVDVDDVVQEWVSTSNMGFIGGREYILATVAGIGQDVILDPGDHTISFKVEVDAGAVDNYIEITPIRLNISLAEYRN